MLRKSCSRCFRIVSGNLLVDYKLLSRDHRKSLVVEGAVVDPSLAVTVAPLSWLERLRSPSFRLPSGYYVEKRVPMTTNGESLFRLSSCSEVNCSLPGSTSSRDVFSEKKTITIEENDKVSNDKLHNGIIAGPLVMYISGENVPIVINPLFVSHESWNFLLKSSSFSMSPFRGGRGEEDMHEMDLRLGLDVIEQCSLFAELRPGGLLYGKLPKHGMNAEKSTESAHCIFRRYGMSCTLSESPLNRRPWTRMKYMFIDELQRGPKLTEFVGYNPRCATPWRFSQHNKHFRQGIWKEIIRRNEMNPGLHTHSSWQKSHQQSVPEVPFMAPFP